MSAELMKSLCFHERSESRSAKPVEPVGMSVGQHIYDQPLGRFWVVEWRFAGNGAAGRQAAARARATLLVTSQVPRLMDSVRAVCSGHFVERASCNLHKAWPG